MVSKGRLEAFSDGVLAIAATLLVIEIHAPPHEPGVSLASALWDQWPSYVAYVVSFMQIGVIWLNHHRMFQTVRAVDGTLLLLNLLLLMWVALIPFPTAVVADYLQDGGSAATTAMALYGGVMLLTAISFVSASSRPSLLSSSVSGPSGSTRGIATSDGRSGSARGNKKEGNNARRSSLSRT